MQWLELSFQDRSPAWIARLEALWTATVQADHSALPRHTVQDLAAGVVQVLRTVAHLTVALDDTGAPVGVLGVSGHSLELFFLPPDQQGTGLGSRLFQHAMAKHYLAQITVWEANTRALGFFLRRSKKETARTGFSAPLIPRGTPSPPYTSPSPAIEKPAACVLYNTGCGSFSPRHRAYIFISSTRPSLTAFCRKTPSSWNPAFSSTRQEAWFSAKGSAKIRSRSVRAKTH